MVRMDHFVLGNSHSNMVPIFNTSHVWLLLINFCNIPPIETESVLQFLLLKYIIFADVHQRGVNWVKLAFCQGTYHLSHLDPQKRIQEEKYWSFYMWGRRFFVLYFSDMFYLVSGSQLSRSSPAHWLSFHIVPYTLLTILIALEERDDQWQRERTEGKRQVEREISIEE